MIRVKTTAAGQAYDFLQPLRDVGQQNATSVPAYNATQPVAGNAEFVLAEILGVIRDSLQEMQGTQKAFYKPKEVAEILNVHVQTVMKWCREGKLAAIKSGRSWLIPHESVEAYVRSCRLIRGTQ